jgi:hypothetical protein
VVVGGNPEDRRAHSTSRHRIGPSRISEHARCRSHRQNHGFGGKPRPTPRVATIVRNAGLASNSTTDLVLIIVFRGLELGGRGPPDRKVNAKPSSPTGGLDVQDLPMPQGNDRWENQRRNTWRYTPLNAPVACPSLLMIEALTASNRSVNGRHIRECENRRPRFSGELSRRCQAICRSSPRGSLHDPSQFSR